MSKVKLTLTIEESVVAHAKILARRNRQSLSDMIEGFLVSAQSEKKMPRPAKMSKALELRGIAKSTLSKKTDKQIRAMMHKDKHGV